jgi:adenylate cyclase
MKKILIFYLTVFLYSNFFSQNKKLADSLVSLHNSKKYAEKDVLSILKGLAVNHPNSDEKLKYSLQLIKLAKQLDSTQYLYSGYLEQGNAYRLKGDFNLALKCYVNAGKIVSLKKNKTDIGNVNLSIASVYSFMGNHKNAINYFEKAILLFKNEKDSLSLASSFLNLGDEYINSNNLELALKNTLEAKRIADNIKYPIVQAYAMGNLGMIYAKQGNDVQAELNITQAITLLEKIEDYYPICVYLTYMSDIYLEKGDKTAALNYLLKSLSLAKEHGLKKEISDASLKLSQLYDKLGNSKASLDYLKNYIIYKDSVNNLETVQKIADLRTDFEVSQKQAEVDLLSQQRRNQRIVVFATIIALGFIVFVAFGLFRRNKFIQKTNKIIDFERKRSDDLLLNILPQSTAEELKTNGKVAAKRFQSVSVLFTDFHGFTNYAENLSPEKLVESVDFYFSKFDEIIEKHGLEKIKTIGDAYMCACGIPFPDDNHALKTVQAAIEIAEFVEKTRLENVFKHTLFEVRLGINSGPVVAGVVGTKKFAYDIWGDTVNTASRLESHSESGKINISESTYGLIKDSYKCDYRGEIEVKNKGLLKMYFIKPQIVFNDNEITLATSSLLQTTI